MNRPVAGSDGPHGTRGDSAGATRQGPRLWGRTTWISIAITVAVLGLMVWKIDVGKVWAELARCDKRLALLGLLAHYATYPVRGVRWRRTVRHLKPTAGGWRFALIVFFYNFVDNVVPAKLGDVYGAHLARINLGVSRSSAMGSIVFLRMIDSWVVLLAAAPAAWLAFAHELPPSVQQALGAGVALAIVITGVLIGSLFLGRISAERLPESIARRLESFRAGMWPRGRELASIAGLTIAIWGLETLWVWFLLLSFDISVDPAQLLFLTMLPILASAFPLTPSGAGVVEFTLFGCLRAVGVGATTAASVTVLNRFIDFWLHILLGVLIWALRHRLGLRTWREVALEEGAAAAAPLAAEMSESA
jgi:hypothetical protein